jgi:hypothetical protein
MAKILMPKATAVWLIDNTTLTFEQIAEFTELHVLEVKGIANGEVAENMRGADPVASGELSREEIDKGQLDANYVLKSPPLKHATAPAPKERKGARFTPVSRRKDRPDAIAWFVKNHPEVTDAQISRLIGTTKATIESVRSKNHWNAGGLKPVDPVTLGLCTQIELDEVVTRAASRRPETAQDRDARLTGPTLRKVAPPAPAPEPEHGSEEQRSGGGVSAEEVFKNFGKSKPEGE